MADDEGKQSFARVKGSIQEQLGREISQPEAVKIMSELTSEHLRSCDSSIPQEYRQ